MRCVCCNRNLSDHESTLKHPITAEYLDICTTCLKDIPITPVPGATSQSEKAPESDDEFSLETWDFEDD